MSRYFDIQSSTEQRKEEEARRAQEQERIDREKEVLNINRK